MSDREDPVSATFKRIAVIRSLWPAQLFGWKPNWEPDLDRVVCVLDPGAVTRSWGIGKEGSGFIVLKDGDEFVFARADAFEVLDQHRVPGDEASARAAVKAARDRGRV